MDLFKYFLATVAILLLATLAANAQILPPPPPSGGAGVPLDPVSWVMLAAGGGYAYRKYKKANTEDE